MKIVGLSAGYDNNYIWIIRSDAPEDRHAWIVDPGVSREVIDYFQQHQLILCGILLTHHHYDHTGGIQDVLASLGDVPVYSNARGPYKHVTHHVTEGDSVDVLGQTFQVLDIPGHTHEHIAFYHPQALFCGDVLFTAGCGKTWTQSPKPMAESLLKLRALNDDCLVYCGHEYTYANINFAAIAEPDNSAVIERQASVKEKTKAGIPCVPERLDVEKQTNPFLRFDTPNLKETLIKRHQSFYNFELDSDANLYATLRAWKDSLDKTGILDSGLNE